QALTPMSLLSDFYVASPEDAVAYDASRALPESERAEFSGLTFTELAELWAVLQGTEATPRHAKAFESVLVAAGGERLINRFPAEFVSSLASLDAASISIAAAKWVQTGELAYLSCQPFHVTPIIDGWRAMHNKTVSRYTSGCASNISFEADGGAAA
ncbi:hypothetical protein, partial [Xanthomonas graminis]